MQSASRACGKAVVQRRFASALGDGINPRQVGAAAKVVRTDGVTSPVLESHFDDSLRTSQLDNGVKVMTKDNGGAIAQVTFLYKDGPVYENIFNAGISSFMKHALNKDSLTSSEYISKTFLQKAGISLSAPTLVNKSHIVLTAEGSRDTLAQSAVMDKYWQSLLFPRFSRDNLKEVKRLVALETTEVKRDTPLQYVQDVLHRTAFSGSPLGHTSYAPGHNVASVSSDSLFDRWDAHYGFSNISVVATNIEHGTLLGALTGSPWLARAHSKTGSVVAPASVYKGGEGYEVAHRACEYDDQFVDVTNTFSAYAFKAPGRASKKDYAAAVVVATALSNATSPVLKSTFGKSNVEVFYKAYDTVGLLGLSTVQATAAQLSGFKAALAKMGTLSEADLSMHKSAASLSLLEVAESWRGTQACLIESFTASGEPVAPAEIAAAIASVTPADVKKIVDAMVAAPATLVHYGASPCAPTLADL